MSRLNLNFNILGEILLGCTWGVNHLSMSRLNLNFKILGEIVVSNTGGPSFLALVHHPNLQRNVSTGFHLGHHRGLSLEIPTSNNACPK